MQLFGMGKDTWFSLAVDNFWSIKDQVKFSSESPDNSYKKGLWPVLVVLPFMYPPIRITPLLVGEVTNVLSYTEESNGRLGPANYNICSIIYQ